MTSRENSTQIQNCKDAMRMRKLGGDTPATSMLLSSSFSSQPGDQRAKSCGGGRGIDVSWNHQLVVEGEVEKTRGFLPSLSLCQLAVKIECRGLIFPTRIT